MQKLNCWQFKNCGFEKGGLLADGHSECPVSTCLKLDGMNDGRGAGRACWMVAKTANSPCYGRSCHSCDFYRRVVFEEEQRASGRLASVAV